jgi:hypothetical protein
MKNLQDATEKICELKGNLVALDTLLSAMVSAMSPDMRQTLLRTFESHAEVARTVMLHAPISELTIAAFERDVRRMTQLAGGEPSLPRGRSGLTSPPAAG